MSSPFLTPKELAARWKMREETLRHWRREGKGPRFIQHPTPRGEVRYPLEAVIEYEMTHMKTPGQKASS